MRLGLSEPVRHHHESVERLIATLNVTEAPTNCSPGLRQRTVGALNAIVSERVRSEAGDGRLCDYFRAVQIGHRFQTLCQDVSKSRYVQ